MDDLEQAEEEIEATFIIDAQQPDKDITSRFKMERKTVGSVEAYLIKFEAP
jgi:hypothetical protein